MANTRQALHLALHRLGVVVSPAELEGLRNCTQRSPLWRDGRKFRLTASDAAAALGLSPWAKSQSLLAAKQLAATTCSEPVPTAAQQHGITNEPVALEAYQLILPGQLRTSPVGVLVHRQRQWLSASPYSLIVDSSKAGTDRAPVVVGLLEIKCPHSQGLPDGLPAHVEVQVGSHPCLDVHAVLPVLEAMLARHSLQTSQATCSTG
eukprot:jgi/Chrzof1/2805/UNPLg00720.t1